MGKVKEMMISHEEVIECLNDSKDEITAIEQFILFTQTHKVEEIELADMELMMSYVKESMVKVVDSWTKRIGL